MRRTPSAVLVAVVACCATLGLSCSADEASQAPPEVPFGDPALGRQAASDYGCGACHRIPGVDGADGLVGPPLDSMGSRSFIAGALANTPENMVRWLRDPRSIEPGTAMPDLGLSIAEARNITAYLASLD